MFDPVSRSWVSLSRPTPSVAGAFLRPIPSQGNSGLLAFEELDGSYEELALSDGELPPPCFWVGNPLTNTWKFIPGVEELLYESIRHPDYEFVVLSEGPPVHFKIVAFGFRGGHVDPGYVSVVYDSATEEWNPGPRFPFRPWLPVIRGKCIVFVCLRWGLQEVQLLSYNLEDDSLDVVLEATRVDANVDFGPGMPLFLGDGQWPLLVAVKPWRTGRLSIHEFKQTDGGVWVLEETLQLLPGLKAVNDLVLAHIRLPAPAAVSDDESDNSNSRTITDNYDGPFLSGNGHLLYVNVSSQCLAMYVPSTDRLSLLPLPFQDRDHASRMGSFPMWSFYPRLDLQV